MARTFTDETKMESVTESIDTLIGMNVDGRFKIVELIGKGAMGSVYRAVQHPLNRAVALKVLDGRYGAGREESFRQRFLVEAALTAKLLHPNTVRVLDFGSADGLYFIAMEYLVGESLDLVLQKGPIAWKRVLHMAQQVARSLREAHDLGVVHRDLKPGNVFLLDADDDHDHIKVLDFGLVKSFIDGHELEGRAVTVQGMLMGSPPYMAPEQGERNRADPRSDIYSLGTVLFECLTGKPPYTGRMPLEIIMKHVNDPIPALVVPENFEAPPQGFIDVVLKCLAKSPMDRFQSMEEMLHASSEVASPILTPAAEIPSVEVKIPAAPATKKGLFILGFFAALALGIFGTVAFMQQRAQPSQVEKTSGNDVEARALPEVLFVHFLVQSTPPGAQVLIGNERKGYTPVRLGIPVGPDGSAHLNAVLVLDGYESVTLSTSDSAPEVHLEQVLNPIPKPKNDAPKIQKTVTKETRASDKKPHKANAKNVVPSKDKPVSRLKEDDEVLPAADDLKRPTNP
jgi:eukaryotic-like serine/threonine-protein kinase